jgi:TPR repeat protein
MLWLRRAADGVVNAQYWYGRMLMEGRGMEADPVEGRAWISRAAEGGMADAQVALCRAVAERRRRPKDHPAALALFRKAGRAGPCRRDVRRGRHARRRP